MNALAANLKTLYQCPVLWFWHAIGLIFIIDGVVSPLTDPVAGQGMFMKYLVVSFWVGMVTASMMKETLGKPFTFCLPGHQRTVRSTIFAVGATQAVVFSLIVLAYPGLDRVATVAGMASAAFLGMTTYLLSVWAMFLIGNAAVFWGVPALFLGLSHHVFIGVRTTIEDAAIFHPWANAVALAAIAVLTWYRLGRRDMAREQCGSIFMPMQYLWTRTALERYGRDRKIKQLERHSNWLWPGIEGRFLARMGRLPAYSAARHAVGSRYAQLGDVLPTSPALVLLGTLTTLTFLVVLGFAGGPGSNAEFSSANFLFFLPAIIGMVVQIPLYSTLLVPAGRSTRYRTCMVIGARGAVVALFLSASLFAVSRAIAALLPEVSLSGESFIYRPMDPGLALSPLLVVPLLYTCQIAFPRNPQFPQTVILIASVLFAMVAPGLFRLESFPILAVLTVLSWWCFVGPLHHYCYHRDLAVG